MTKRVAIVGGGVSGLTTAYRLLAAEGPPEVVVVEADGRPGGKLRSVDVGGFSLEAGPDSFAARKPWAAALCRELGLGEELVEPATSRAYVWTDRGLVVYPRSAFGVAVDVREFLRWPGLSVRGKLRAARDLLMRARREEGDESLGSLVRRRLGDEVADVLVSPLLGGLWAGDADRLSVRATFPELEAWERDFGSLIRGARAAMRRSSSGDAAPLFVTLRGGVERLVLTLASAVGGDRIRCGRPADSIDRAGASFVVETGGETFEADAVVLATPAFVAAGLVRELAPEAAAALDAIPYVSTAVAVLVYPSGTAQALPDGSGFVVPHGKAAMTACTFVSSKWPEERFGDRAVVRCFVGAAGSEDVLEADDAVILDAVTGQLADLVGLPEPEAARLVRWMRSMPQYEVGHVERVREAMGALPPGVFLTGSAYDGVGIPDCVRGAGETAARALDHLAGRRKEREGAR